MHTHIYMHTHIHVYMLHVHIHIRIIYEYVASFSILSGKQNHYECYEIRDLCRNQTYKNVGRTWEVKVQEGDLEHERKVFDQPSWSTGVGGQVGVCRDWGNQESTTPAGVGF